MSSIYSFFIQCYGLLIHVASRFNPKAKAWIEGRKQWQEKLRTQIPKERKVLWFHCASLGEFDQGLPLMKSMKETEPSLFLLVSFFSPSGMEHYEKREKIVDSSCYLPLDTLQNARTFVKIVQPQKTDEAENNTDYTQIILKNLKMMQQLEYKNKAPFKARAYTNVIKQIGELTRPIKTVDDVGKLGKGIKERIELIIKQGYLEETKEALENTSQFDAIEAFSNIMSIGPVKAKALVTEHNIKSIDELRKNQHLLNDKQKMGLRYYEDFLERIPRNEMDMHLQHIEKAIKQHDPDMTFQIVGSYRRGVLSSGDIDVLVTHPENKKDAFEKIIKHLKTTGYLVDDFASGKEKYLGVSKLENYPVNRRIDILYMDPHRFPFALLYFTGDKGFNVQLRNRALSLGYSLSEHGLKYTSGPNKNGIVDDDFKSERDIFTFLKAQYVEPKNRNQYAVKALLV